MSNKYYNYQLNKAAHERYVQRHPWMPHYTYARRRCDVGGKYYKKGIKFLLSKKDLMFLWFRDKAYILKNPSIDRKDSKGNYEFSNCRFIEMIDNVGKEDRDRTHCHKGHLLSEENIYRINGRRRCRICSNEYKRKWLKAKNKRLHPGI